MANHSLLSRWARSTSYWTRWVLLEMYGPATQDEATDPVEMLKREYGRTAPRPRRHRH